MVRLLRARQRSPASSSPLPTQPHEDGGAYFPAVATVSLGSHTLLDIYRYAAEPAAAATEPSGAEAEASGAAPGARAREQEPAFSILQERRSLLITRGSAYKCVSPFGCLAFQR